MMASESENDSRREFLKHLLAGSVSATVLMVISLGSFGRRKDSDEEGEHEYA